MHIVSIVLNWLEKCFSLQNLPLKELTMKLVALPALSTAQRVQVLKMMKINMLLLLTKNYVLYTQ